MRIGLEAGAKPRCGNRSRERQPRNQTPLPRIYLLCTRVKAAVRRAYWGSHRQGRFESSAVEALWEKAGKLRISAAHTLCNA